MSRPFRLTPQKLPRLSENDVESACKDLLGLRGYKLERLHAGTFRSVDGSRWIKGVDKGTPDYVAMHGKYPAFYLETKRPGGKPSPEQEQKHLEIHLGYHITIAVIDSVEALGFWLNQHERQARESWFEWLKARGP